MAKTTTTGPTYQPLFDNVLVRPLDPDQMTSSGIVLPDTVKEKPQMGVIMAVGPGVAAADGKLIAMQVKSGQKVLYKKWGGDEIKVNGEDWMVLGQKDILAIVE